MFRFCSRGALRAACIANNQGAFSAEPVKLPVAQSTHRDHAFSANGDGGPFCGGDAKSKGDDYDWSSLAPPKFDVTMDNWNLCDGEDGTCPAGPGSICNYVGDRTGDWNIQGGTPGYDDGCAFESPFPW